MEKKISTWLSQLACLGVKTNCQRGVVCEPLLDLGGGAGGEVVGDGDHLRGRRGSRLRAGRGSGAGRSGCVFWRASRSTSPLCTLKTGEQVLCAVADVLVLAPERASPGRVCASGRGLVPWPGCRSFRRSRRPASLRADRGRARTPRRLSCRSRGRARSSPTGRADAA